MYHSIELIHATKKEHVVWFEFISSKPKWVSQYLYVWTLKSFYQQQSLNFDVSDKKVINFQKWLIKYGISSEYLCQFFIIWLLIIMAY